MPSTRRAPQPIPPNTTVGYSRAFLTSVGGSYAIAQRRGRVIGPSPELGEAYLVVSWNDAADAPHTVRAGVVARVGSLAFCD